MNLRQNGIGTIGGMALASALEWNRSIRVLKVSDNMIGPEVIANISGRLNGNVKDICESVSYNQLELLMRYASGRFDWLDLKSIIKSREDKNQRKITENYLLFKKIAVFLIFL